MTIKWVRLGSKSLISVSGRWAIAQTLMKGVYRLLDRDDKAAWHESGFPSKNHHFQVGTRSHLKRLAAEASEDNTHD